MSAPTAKEALLNLINQDNNLSLTFSQVMFNEPLATNDVPNTLVTVYPANNSYLVGQKEVFYNRLPISSWQVETFKFNNTEEITTSKIIDKVNAKNFINVTSADIADFQHVHSVPAEQEENIQLDALPSSYAWHGSVGLSIKRTDAIDIGDVIENDTLNGLNMSDLLT